MLKKSATIEMGIRADLLATLLQDLESSSVPESTAVADNEILKRMNAKA